MQGEHWIILDVLCINIEYTAYRTDLESLFYFIRYMYLCVHMYTSTKEVHFMDILVLKKNQVL